jgi:predicted DNA-binding transcriptional regulator AlpA
MTMLTVSALADRCGLSRSAVLYYEAKGVLPRPSRTAGNYRATARTTSACCGRSASTARWVYR